MQGRIGNGRGWTASAEEAADGSLITAPVTAKWAKQSGGPSGDEVLRLVAEPFSMTGQGDEIQARETDEATGLTAGYERTVDRGTFVAGTLKGQRGKAGGGIGPEETLVPDTAATLTSSGNAKSQPNRQKEDDVNLVAFSVTPQGHRDPASQSGFGGFDEAGLSVSEVDEAPTLDQAAGSTRVVQPFSKRHAANHAEDDERWEQSEEAHTLNQNMNPADVVAYSFVPEGGQGADLRASEVDTAPTLDTVQEARKADRGTRIANDVGVRRLTPVECERLQGFPDHWTAIDGEATPDGKRYAALGDAVTVNVAQWVAERLVRYG